MKPRVLIAMASGILGGPGKGLAQFLRSGGLEGCYPLVAAYNRNPDMRDTEFILAMRATGAPVAILRQRRTLDLSLVRQGLELIKKHDINLLQSHGYKSHVLCWLLRRRTGLPWIAFVHGWTAENLKVRLYNGLEQAMLLFADEVVAVSESLKSRLLPPVRAACRVIPNAIECEAGCENSDVPNPEVKFPPGAIVAGVVGRLSPEKGQKIFVRALARARERDSRLYGLILGDGQEREHLERDVRTLGLEGKCLFTGYVRNLFPYYRSLNMQVLPSFKEGMPNAALEGMAAGLPLIASKVGGVPEVVADGLTGILLPAGDEEALARTLVELAADPERGRRMGEAGRARAHAEFSPSVRAGRFLGLYRDLLRLRKEKKTC